MSLSQTRSCNAPVPDPFQKLFGRLKDTSSNPTKNLAMRQVLSVSKPHRLPSWKQWKQLPSVLSKTEQRVIQTALLLFVLSLLITTGTWLFGNRVEVPAKGGEYTEALVGEPQLVNPLYAMANDADQDLVSLIYSGLLRFDPTDGLVPDLAESYEVNDEKTVYTFVLKEGARFHNGDPVLARDVLFTISAIQNPAYRSPLIGALRGVSVVQEDDRKISFVLEKPQSAFLSNLTVGILPSSAWADILPQNAPLAALNLQPIGSGPYRFAEFSKDKKGSVRTYTLEPFEDAHLGEPYIERLTFKFYPDAALAIEALDNRFVEGVSVIPFEAREQTGQNRAIVLHSPLLSREAVLYFNQKTNELLKKKEVREAIARAINKQAIVDETLLGVGRVIIGPVLPDMEGYHEGLTDIGFDVEKAKEVFVKEAGEVKEADDIVKTKLTLTTVASEEFIRVAEALKSQLELAGLSIEVVTVPATVIFEQIVAPRNFELLLTSVMYNTQADPYLFWHSSQKEAGGLNIVEYQNAEVDKLLETARAAKTPEERAAALKTFQEKLLADLPAVFLYQSTYGYATARKIQGVELDRIRIPSDRFTGITDWYIKTKKAFR